MRGCVLAREVGGEGGDQSLGTWGKERILTNIQLISILF